MSRTYHLAYPIGPFLSLHEITVHIDNDRMGIFEIVAHAGDDGP